MTSLYTWSLVLGWLVLSQAVDRLPTAHDDTDTRTFQLDQSLPTDLGQRLLKGPKIHKDRLIGDRLDKRNAKSSKCGSKAPKKTKAPRRQLVRVRDLKGDTPKDPKKTSKGPKKTKAPKTTKKKKSKAPKVSKGKKSKGPKKTKSPKSSTCPEMNTKNGKKRDGRDGEDETNFVCTASTYDLIQAEAVQCLQPLGLLQDCTRCVATSVQGGSVCSELQVSFCARADACSSECGACLPKVVDLFGCFLKVNDGCEEFEC